MIDDLESRLQSSIISDLESMGDRCVVFKIQRTNKRGIPDLFFTTAMSGPFFLEVKKPDGVTSEQQKMRISELNTCGCKAIVCYSWKEWIEIKLRIGLTTKS